LKSGEHYSPFEARTTAADGHAGDLVDHPQIFATCEAQQLERRPKVSHRAGEIAGGDVGGVFVVFKDGELQELEETAYDSEAVLQTLLARYPSLLSGDRPPGAPAVRWLLVAREIGIPSEENAGNRFALDHLFLDQDAVPTLVEVKRDTDTRIRREVVGQMLDYAANAVVYWPIETVMARFQARCESSGRDAAEVFEEVFGPDADPDEFWQRAKTNLQAGRVRLVFVADEIPPELRRIVEFLNVQMDPAEVLALEVRQFVGGDLKTLVPQVIGRTAEAEQKKTGATSARRRWDEPSFFAELAAVRGEEDAAAARKVYEWVIGRGLRIAWGTGAQSGSLIPYLDTATQRGLSLLVLWTDGTVGLRHGCLSGRRPPFDEEHSRHELWERLVAIPGVDLSLDAVNAERWFPISALTGPEALARFMAVMDWAFAELRRCNE
jgi:hypothetical protein